VAIQSLSGKPKSREQLEEAYRLVALRKIQAEISARKKDPVKIWLSQFADDPNGFIREIIGEEWDRPSWMPWRAFISTVFALGYKSDAERDLYFACTSRTEIPKKPFREVWAPIGRRGGKSRIFALLAVWLASCRDWRKYLVAGEEGVIPIIADARDRALQTMGYVRAAFQHPQLKNLVLRDLSEEIYLKNNVIIRVSTASVKAARSRTVLSALCDEIAFWTVDDLGANPDKEIIRSLRPAMLTIPDSMLFCLSSPYARRGELWDQYTAYFGKDDERRLIWQADTYTMHPTVDRDEIEQAYRDDPVAASAEYGAQFRTDVEVILPQEVVMSVVPRGCFERLPAHRCVYKAFVDPSGGSSDSMTLAIAHYDVEKKCAVLDAVREARPPFSPESVVAEFSEVIRRYGLVSVTGDKYAGMWPRERFALHGVQYEVEEKTRSELYQSIIPLINSGKVELLDNTTLIRQLCSLERRTRSSARDLIDHPPGGHDDLANAAAGALVGVAYKGGEIWSKPWTTSSSMIGGLPTSGFLYAQQRRRSSRYMR
jgi:hypothetical protein